MSKRLAGRFGYPADDPFTPTFHPERLDKPLHWRKPRRIFVCSMSDLFHEAFTDEDIADVMLRTIQAHQHTYVILTKRPERMREWFAMWTHDERGELTYAPTNLWLGVTVENQARADERIPVLLDTPAAVRFVCCEPLLGAVDLRMLHYQGITNIDALEGRHGVIQPGAGHCAKLDWVIVGGENGPGARPMEPGWLTNIGRQCKAAGVPLWVKGVGSGFRVGDCPIHDLVDLVEFQNLRELPAVPS